MILGLTLLQMNFEKNAERLQRGELLKDISRRVHERQEDTTKENPTKNTSKSQMGRENRKSTEWISTQVSNTIILATTN